MASCNLDRGALNGDFPFDYKDAIVQRYKIQLDAATTDLYSVLTTAQGLGLPVRRQRYSPASQSFCNNIRLEQTAERSDFWIATVTFGPPPEGTEEDEHEETNPLARPPVYNIDFIEQEYAIENARNVEELTGGFTRPSGTNGPIVNAAFRRPDEPIMDTERNAVLTVMRNYPSLVAIIDLNEQYQRTTNDDSVSLGSGTISARRLRYLLTESQGKQVENEIEFWPGVTRIEVRKTTDLIIPNVGYEYWDDVAELYVRTDDAFGRATGDPVNLNLDGSVNDDAPITITYRHLEEVDYTPLLS